MGVSKDINSLLFENVHSRSSKCKLKKLSLHVKNNVIKLITKNYFVKHLCIKFNCFNLMSLEKEKKKLKTEFKNGTCNRKWKRHAIYINIYELSFEC